MTNNNIIINLNNINKIYGEGDNAVQALKDINLKIEKGDMVAIMGESGSGKSTLLNIIGLLDNPNGGEYFLKEKNVIQQKEKEKAFARNKIFGFVVQDFALIEKYTVKQNLEIPFAYCKERYSRQQRNEIINNVLQKLKLNDKVNQLACNLSGGQRQRVAIGRALVMNPDVILADEPTGALDSKTSADIMKIFSELNTEGKTIIIITHSNDVANCCEKKIYIEDGRIKK